MISFMYICLYVFIHRFGRKKILIMEIIVQILSGCGAGLVSNLILFILLRFISTAATGGLMLTSFVLLMEFTGTYNYL